MPVWLACQRSGAGAKTEPREPGPLHSGGGKLVDRPRGVAGQTVPAMGPVPSRTTLCVGPRPSARPCCEAAPPCRGSQGPAGTEASPLVCPRAPAGPHTTFLSLLQFSLTSRSPGVRALPPGVTPVNLPLN